ncbi:hypothetical protein [Rhizobium leguminosarum]|uniref:hypothetical protein n=1 Tax=Rhizobium leguminosarum TaxID=384 RepID=UPI003F994499
MAVLLAAFHPIREGAEVKKALPNEPIFRALYRHTYDVQEALKRFFENNTFSLTGIDERRANQKLLLAAHGHILPSNSFHESWALIDHQRRSAACFREQARSRIWALGTVFPDLVDAATGGLFVTFADSSDQRKVGRLHKFNPIRYRRRIIKILKALAVEFPGARALGVVEVSASTTDDGVVFEPHAHVLVFGANEVSTRDKFSDLLRGRATGRPLKIQSIDSVEVLGRRLSYCFKFSPELRSTFLRDGARSPGYDNVMSGPVLAEWYRWLAAYRASDLLIHMGQRPQFIAEMNSREMQPLIDSLLRSSLKMPPRDVQQGSS